MAWRLNLLFAIWLFAFWSPFVTNDASACAHWFCTLETPHGYGFGPPMLGVSIVGPGQSGGGGRAAAAAALITHPPAPRGVVGPTNDDQWTSSPPATSRKAAVAGTFPPKGQPVCQSSTNDDNGTR
jgi:hypothetical protein